MLQMERKMGRKLKGRLEVEGYFVALHDSLEREMTLDPTELSLDDLRARCARMEDGVLGAPNGEDHLALAFEMANGQA